MHQNHFNLIRMIAASLVLLSHSFALSTGDPMLEPLRRSLGVTWGSIAVDIFFVTSGYLVTMSIFRRADLKTFVVSRALRIYPGLVVALFVTVAITSIWFGDLSLSAFWTHYQTWKYLIKNALLVLPSGIEWTVPGALSGVPTATPRGTGLNGSLWTLPVELKMYAYLAVGFIVLRELRRWHSVSHDLQALASRVLPAIAVIALVYDIVTSVQGDHVLERHMFTMFFTGAALWSAGVNFREREAWAAGILLAIVAAAFIDARLFMAVYILGLPFAVLALAFSRGDLPLRYNRLGDYSYGVYIYAYPVQQWCAYAWKGISPTQMTLLAFPLTLLFAVLSWHLVEKRALALKPAPKQRDAPS